MQISSYRTEIFTTSVVTSKVGWYCIWPETTKWLKINDIFPIIFDSTFITRKQIVELKFSTKVEQLLPQCIRKLNEFNSTKLIIDSAIKIFLAFCFHNSKTIDEKLVKTRLQSAHCTCIAGALAHCFLIIFYLSQSFLSEER